MEGGGGGRGGEGGGGGGGGGGGEGSYQGSCYIAHHAKICSTVRCLIFAERNRSITPREDVSIFSEVFNSNSRGAVIPLPLAMVVMTPIASSTFPFTISHRGDSGRDLCEEPHVVRCTGDRVVSPHLKRGARQRFMAAPSMTNTLQLGTR